MQTYRQIRTALVTAVCILRHFQLRARYIISLTQDMLDAELNDKCSSLKLHKFAAYSTCK